MEHLPRNAEILADRSAVEGIELSDTFYESIGSYNVEALRSAATIKAAVP